MSSRTKRYLFLAFALLTAAVALGETAGTNGLCANFAANGSFAKAKLGKALLTVEIARQAEPNLTLTMPLIVSGNRCHAFFSSDSELLAVSVEDKLHPYAPVQIAVANAGLGKWLQPMPYTASLAMDARGPLVGFLDKRHTLFVLSSGTYFPGESRSLLYPVLIDLPSGAVHLGLIPVTGAPFGSATGAVNPPGGAVWVSATGDRCGFQAMRLNANFDGEPGATRAGDRLRALGCSQPDLVFACADNEIVVGFEKANQFILAALGAQAGTPQTVTLEAVGRDGFLQPGNVAISPDGQTVAVQFRRFDIGHSGARPPVNEVVTFATAPWRTIATSKVDAGADLLAVADAVDGAVTVAFAERNGTVSLQKVTANP